MGKVLIILTVLFIPLAAAAENLDEVVSRVHSPDELEQFYQDEFEYIFEIPSAHQTPEETLKLKSGSCEDLAILSQAILKRIGIDSEVVYIKYKDLDIGHAICAWKEGGHYNYFSNRKLMKTNLPSIQDILQGRASDLECCTACKRKLDIATGQCEPR